MTAGVMHMEREKGFYSRVFAFTNSRKFASPGFTLIELLIVVAIIAILGVMTIPGWFRQMESWKLDAAAEQIQSHIRLAQERAISEQKNYGVGFSTGDNLYSVYGENGVIEDPIKGKDLIVYFDTDDQLKGIEITTVNFGENSYVNFGFLGDPTAGGYVTIKDKNGNEKDISVYAETGSVRIW